MKKLNLLFSVFLFLFLVSCSNEKNNDAKDEVITQTGIEEASIYLGDTFDLFEGVTFTSSTQGDITDTVETTGNVNLSQLGIHTVTYQTHYKNNELYSVDRRIIVLNPPFNTSIEDENMLLNGDFSDTMNHWEIAHHNDYPNSIRFMVDPNLNRMRFILGRVTDNGSYPNLNQSNLTFDTDNEYQISMLVSGTLNTFFTIDIVELDQTGQVTHIIYDAQTINVRIQPGYMTEVQFTFTPLLKTTNATFRVMFGHVDDNDLTKELYKDEIYIDNVVIKVND